MNERETIKLLTIALQQVRAHWNIAEDPDDEDNVDAFHCIREVVEEALAAKATDEIERPECLIFDQNTSTLYHMSELEGPYRNGLFDQYNIPHETGAKKWQN